MDGKTITIRITSADNQWIGWVKIGEIISLEIVSISPDTLILSGSVLGILLSASIASS